MEVKLRPKTDHQMPVSVTVVFISAIWDVVNGSINFYGKTIMDLFSFLAVSRFYGLK